MRYAILILLSLMLTPMAWGQKKSEIWSKARIHFSPGHTMRELAGLGVETDHGTQKPGFWFVSAFSQEELRRIRSAGFQADILIPDVTADFLERNRKAGPAEIQADYFAGFCNRVKTYKVPSRWSLGSMGGHLKYEEMLAHLDSMHARYPGLISARFAIDPTLTHQGRTIWGVRLSDNAAQSEPGEPQALYSAVHHAREPVGMHQLIFFMWYLLENYGASDEIKALVNNSELYFVPCLNPDGYIDNQTNFPEGGGMRRKNMAPLSSGGFGVDLNRNYGYQWGYDNFGSSPDEDWDTYRGPSAFSEPETQAMRAFCENHNFKIAQNYHTYSNINIHPWGYENIQCPDSVPYRLLTGEMARENNYRNGTCQEVLNYLANGGSDDYMYHPTPEKEKILAITPEVGEWFWPQSNEILGQCLETVHQNLTAIRALHPMLRIEDTTGLFLRAGTAAAPGPFRFRYNYTRMGVNTDPAATFTITLRAFGPAGTGIPELSKQYSTVSMNKTITDSLVFPANIAALEVPSRIGFEVAVSNGLFLTRDTVYHIAGQPDILAVENCDEASRWTGSWVISNQNPAEGTGCLRSGSGNYPPLARLLAQRRRPFDLSVPGISEAEMSLKTRFELEQNFDYTGLSFSTDSGLTWVNVCTDRTRFSAPFSDQAGTTPDGIDSIVPMWDGTVRQWRKEFIDLRDYIGKKLWIRFILRSDEGNELAGFEVDDIQIRANTTPASRSEALASKEAPLIFPNPGGKETRLRVGPSRNRAQLQLINSLGQTVWKSEMAGQTETNLPGHLPPGIYRLRIGGDGLPLQTSLWVKTP